MLTFALKPQTTQQRRSAKAPKSGQSFARQSRDVHTILHIQRTISNQAILQSRQSKTEGLEVRSASNGSPRLAHDFSRIPAHDDAPMNVMPKLEISSPGDAYEQEADWVANQVMRMPDKIVPKAPNSGAKSFGSAPPSIQRVGVKGDGETNENGEAASKKLPGIMTSYESPDVPSGNVVNLIQTKSYSGRDQSEVAPSIQARIRQIRHRGGQPLSESSRAFMEPRFQHDFSSVRVHTDAEAAQSAAALGAYAYTVEHDIVFGTGQYQPDTTRGRGLLAHELAHTVQQKGMSKKLQRRLNITGTQADVDDYLAALERVSGFDLDWTAPGPRVTIAGNTDFGTQSTTGRARLQTIINNAAQHAQLTIGTHQHRVGVGAHPGAGGGAQRIDIDDIRNLNAALPGQGDAKAFHEMVENYDANSAATLGLPAATRFGTSHAQGIEIESDVLEESTIRGRRLSGGVPMTAIPAPAGQPIGPGITYHRSIQNRSIRSFLRFP